MLGCRGLNSVLVQHGVRSGIHPDEGRAIIHHQPHTFFRRTILRHLCVRLPIRIFMTIMKRSHSIEVLLSLQLGGSVMLGLGIWVTTQDTEYKHLAGNQVCFSFVFLWQLNEIKKMQVKVHFFTLLSRWSPGEGCFRRYRFWYLGLW